MNNTENERIGVDKLKVSNFTYELDDENALTLSLSEKSRTETEKYTYEDKIINKLELSVTKTNGFDKSYNAIEFNPNKILSGYNIQNATHKELKKAIEKLKQHLKTLGLTVNFDNAIIQNIEININFWRSYIDFLTVFEVFALILKNCEYHGKYKEYTYNFKDIQQDTWIVKPWKTKTLKFYDKAFQMFSEYGITIPDVFRIEYFFEVSMIYRFCKQTNRENDLSLLLDNDDFINEMFVYHFKKDILNHVQQELKQHKKKLEIAFFDYKKFNSKSRGVFQHLQNLNIFDKSWILEILRKWDKVENEPYKSKKSRSASRDYRKFKEQYPGYDGLEKLSYIQDKILQH